MTSCADGGDRDTLALDQARHPQTLIAYGMNGADLPLGHGGPLERRGSVTGNSFPGNQLHEKYRTNSHHHTQRELESGPPTAARSRCSKHCTNIQQNFQTNSPCG